MLLPQELMQVLSPSSNAASSSSPLLAGRQQTEQTGLNWLAAARSAASDGESNYQIIMDFLSNEGGQADFLSSTFASDLRTLIQDMSRGMVTGDSLGPELSQAVPEVLLGNLNLQPAGAELETDFSVPAWSVEELLQFYATAAESGNVLPPADETLPHAIIAALMAGTLRLEAEQSTDLTGVAIADASTAVSGVVESALIEPETPNPLAADDLMSLVGENRLSETDSESSRTLLAEDRLAQTAAAVEKVDANAVPPSMITGQPDRANARPAAGLEVGLQKATLMNSALAGETEVDEALAQPRQTERPAPATLTPLASNLVQPAAFSQSAELTSTQALFQQAGAAVGGTQPTEFDSAAGRTEQRMFSGEIAQTAGQATANRTADMLPRFDLQTSFGQQGWPDSIGRQLLVMNGQGISAAQIRLDPPELGSLMVKIQLNSDQQASVSFVSPHAAVREALEQQSVRLQDLLKEQGLDLVNVSVSDEAPQQGQEFAQQRHQQQSNADDLMEQEQAAVSVPDRPASLIDYYV